MVFFCIFCFFVFISLAAVVILTALNLTKAYSYRFLNYYLYFLVFFYIYGFIYFVGSSFNILIFLPQDHSLMTAVFSLVVLASPAYIFYLFFLIMWVAELLGKKLPVWFRWGYFSLQLLLLVPVVLQLVRKINTRNPDLLVPGSSVFFSFGGIIFFLSVAFLYFGARLQPNEKKKALAKSMGLFYLVGYPVMILLTDRIRLPFYSNPTLMLLFLAFLAFSLNVPPLLYLRRHLRRCPLETIRIPIADLEVQEFSIRHKLTHREKEIVELIMAGRGTKEIGEKLFISGKTVKNNLSSIFQKTGAKNRVQLMSFVQNYHR